MANLSGKIAPSTRIHFVALENTAQLLAQTELIIYSATDGSYSAQVFNGRYNIQVGNLIYKNIDINRDGSLNNFLERANGCHL